MSKSIYTHTKSADFAIAHLRAGTLALAPYSQINNNETYADMTICPLRNSRTGTKVIPVGIYRYFAFDYSLIKSVLSFLRVKYKASINAIQYVNESP